MRAAFQYILLALYVGQLLGPALIITDFLVERDRIARDLCVQRELTEGMRTCHGECHMMKQLHAAEQAAAQHTPPSLPVKSQPEWIVEFMGVAKALDGVVIGLPVSRSVLLAGAISISEPVPWC
ncbi:MAG: hypothetical protein ABI599_00380 [Flavobacteriales bacterium]